MKRLLQGTSRQEIEVYNFVKSLLPGKRVVKNDRTVLAGKELDIYIPSLKLAIEFNGLFFHNNMKRPDPYYHLQKSINCERKGIRLIQIMSDEWEQKKTLVMDLIRKACNIYEHLDASKCKIKVLTEKEGQGFFENNHLLGNDKRSSLFIGLFFDRNLLFCASFSKEKYNWVLTRFGDKKGYKIYNALSLILDYFFINYEGPLTTSLDRRLYESSDLKSVGFKEITSTSPNITVTKDFKKRIPLNKIKKLNESELEKNGYYKVYDCGERRFIKE